jgi:hypothetical protein
VNLRIQALRNIHGTIDHAGALSDQGGPTPPKQGIVPEYLLKNLANSKDAETRESARHGITLSREFRSARRDAAETVAKIPALPRKDRIIYDMDHSEDRALLPGKLVYSEAQPLQEDHWTDQAVGDCYDNLGLSTITIKKYIAGTQSMIEV